MALFGKKPEGGMMDMIRCDMQLEQVGVGAGAVKVDNIVLNAVHQEPVRLNVAFSIAFVVAVKEMFMVFCGERCLINEHIHYRDTFSHGLTAPVRKRGVFLELVGKSVSKHGLSVQGFEHVVKGMIDGPGYLPVNHVLHFLHGRNGNGVGGVVHGAGKPGVKLSLGKKAGGFRRGGGFARFLVRDAGNGKDKARGAGFKRFRHVKINLQPPVGGYGYGLL
jgi:hypothetical protein